MIITKTDPLRIRIHSDQIRNIKPMGFVISGHKDYNDPDNYLVSFKATDTKPYQPELETTVKENLDKVLEQFNIRQDRIREHKPHRLFKEQCNEKIITIDEKKFAKMGNKYDLLIDKLKIVDKNNNKGVYK